ncbi:sigma factor G inhibitor Gin [Bacillus sp. JJ722]|uniref:sigma factor G inhibitor Gin n=1 Tax=Bacillus sp. JJ722 TaxID=3122973 RepID=UPI002FFFAB6C
MDAAAKVPIGETCIICEKLKSEGIYLYASFVCRSCEEDIIKTETSDPRYQYYLQQLRKVNNPEK